MTSARLSDPQVLADMRTAMVRFLATCDGALGGHIGEIHRVRDWLRGDRASHWRRQLQKREEAFQEARRAFLSAEADVNRSGATRGPTKPSSLEERLEMERARRLRDAAQQHLETIRLWQGRLDHDGADLVAQCRNHQLDLRERCVRAIQRLEQLEEAVHAYLAIETSMSSVDGRSRDAQPAIITDVPESRTPTSPPAASVFPLADVPRTAP